MRRETPVRFGPTFRAGSTFKHVAEGQSPFRNTGNRATTRDRHFLIAPYATVATNRLVHCLKTKTGGSRALSTACFGAEMRTTPKGSAYAAARRKHCQQDAGNAIRSAGSNGAFKVLNGGAASLCCFDTSDRLTTGRVTALADVRDGEFTVLSSRLFDSLRVHFDDTVFSLNFSDQSK